jgi:hypothetical protein
MLHHLTKSHDFKLVGWGFVILNKRLWLWTTAKDVHKRNSLKFYSVWHFLSFSFFLLFLISYDHSKFLISFGHYFILIICFRNLTRNRWWKHFLTSVPPHNPKGRKIHEKFPRKLSPKSFLISSFHDWSIWILNKNTCGWNFATPTYYTPTLLFVNSECASNLVELSFELALSNNTIFLTHSKYQQVELISELLL